MKELYQGGKIPENRQNQGYVQRKKKRLHNLRKDYGGAIYYLF